jgi:Tetraacyldisaccharide-1-P 4'-kinase
LKVFEYAAVPRGLFSADGQTGVPLEALSGKRVLAFAGIARPRRFFSQLESLGAAVVGRMTFPDHHLYPAASRARIAAAVSRTDPEMVLTTEKDAVKFEAGELPWEGPGLTVLRIGLDLPDEFFECLEAAVFPGKAGHA